MYTPATPNRNTQEGLALQPHLGDQITVARLNQDRSEQVTQLSAAALRVECIAESADYAAEALHFASGGKTRSVRPQEALIRGQYSCRWRFEVFEQVDGAD